MDNKYQPGLKTQLNNENDSWWARRSRKVQNVWNSIPKLTSSLTLLRPLSNYHIIYQHSPSSKGTQVYRIQMRCWRRLAELGKLKIMWKKNEMDLQQSYTMHYCNRGAPPLRIVQVWKIISQHQIIVKTWKFLCMTQTLLKIIINFFKFFSLLKICRKSIKPSSGCLFQTRLVSKNPKK